MAEKTGNKIKKVVLAYSGGLDTSVIIPWLKENYEGVEVIAFAADLGQEEELHGLIEKGKKTGASQVIIEDLRRQFVTDFIFPMVRAGAIYEGRYMLGTSIARPLIAMKQVETARKFGADAVSHGATGKGNDQVRFELTYKALAPDLKIIAPWREWDLESREDEINYAKARGIPVSTTKKQPWSRDRNLWHMSHEGGILEDPSKPPPDSLFVLTADPKKAPARGEVIALEFHNGVPVGLNGKTMDPLDLVLKLNKIGAGHGIGRVDIVENRLVGIKSRGVYETPGGAIIMEAHKDLEAITLDRDTLHYKEMVALRYAELIYFGQWFCPLREALDAFVLSTQKNVEGTVTMELCRGNIRILGRESKKSLYMMDLATFEAGGWYDQRDAGGFINLFGLQMKVNALRQGRGSRKTQKRGGK